MITTCIKPTTINFFPARITIAFGSHVLLIYYFKSIYSQVIGLGSRQGSLLEKNIQRIFNLAGFSTELNKRIHGYEVDVFAEVDGKRVVIECKQYEKGGLNIRNLIHQWSNKNKIIEADRVVIAIYGHEIPKNALSLAKDESIILWNNDGIDEVLDAVIEHKDNAKEYLFGVLCLEEEIFEGVYTTSIDIPDYASAETERYISPAIEKADNGDFESAIKLVDEALKTLSDVKGVQFLKAYYLFKDSQRCESFGEISEPSADNFEVFSIEVKELGDDIFSRQDKALEFIEILEKKYSKDKELKKDLDNFRGVIKKERRIVQDVLDNLSQTSEGIEELSEKIEYNLICPHCKNQFIFGLPATEIEVECPKCRKQFLSFYATVVSKRQSYEDITMRLQLPTGQETMMHFRSDYKVEAQRGDCVIFYFKKSWMNKEYSKPSLMTNVDINNYVELS